MLISSFSIFRYKIPLTAPLRFPMRRLYRREGLLMRAAGAERTVGWGEAAPLPGFSREHLQQATRQAFKLKRMMTGREIGDDPSAFESITGDMELVPSVRFGFELAMRSLCAEVQEKSLVDMLPGEASRPTVAVNGLLAGDREEIVEAAECMREEGYRAAKLKVGGPDVKEDVERVVAVREALGPDVALRLDANRAWEMDEAKTFVDGLSGVPFEYLEEPLYDSAGLPTFAETTGVPVALDESLLDIAPGDLSEHAYAAAVILKPTLLGGLSSILRMAEEAADVGMTPVISGAYEGGIGMLGLIALAAVVGERDVPAGLDTYRRLEKDVMRPRLRFDGGVVDVASALSTKRTLNGHMLREV